MSTLLKSKGVYSVCRDGIVYDNLKVIGTLHIGRTEKLSPKQIESEDLKSDRASLHFKPIDSPVIWDISKASSIDEILTSIHRIRALNYPSDLVAEITLPRFVMRSPEHLRLFENRVNEILLLKRAEGLILSEAI